MAECTCSKEKEIAQLEIKVDRLEKRDEQLYVKIKDNSDKIHGIEKVAFEINRFAEKLIELTEEIKNIKLCMDTVKKVPDDYYEMKTEYTRLKKLDANIEHYKKVAIGTIIIAIISAFLIGLKVSL